MVGGKELQIKTISGDALTGPLNQALLGFDADRLAWQGSCMPLHWE